MAAALPIAGLTLVAFVVRVVGIDQSPFGDELFTYRIVTRPSLGDALADVRSPLEITPPLFFVLSWLSAQIGDPAVWLRLPSLLAGTAVVPVVYALGLRTVGRTPALVAAALAALSPFAIFYADEARAYALMALCTAVSTLGMLEALEKPGRRGWWAAFAVASAAAMYSHYTAIFVLVAQSAWAVVVHRDRLRELGLANLAAAVGFAPWLPEMLDDRGAFATAVIELLAPLSLDSFLTGVVKWTAGAPYEEPSVLPGRFALALLGVAVVAGLVGVVRRRETSAELVLVALLAVATPVGTVVYSLVGEDLFYPRNLMASQPALFLALAAVVTAPRRPLAAAATGLAVTCFAIGAVKALQPRHQRPDYRAVAAFLDERAGPRDPVLEVSLLDPSGPSGQALEIHLDRPHPLFDTGRPGGTRRALAAARTGRLFVVTPHSGIPALSALGRRRQVERRDFRGLEPLAVYVYED